jgi:RNA polymerase sigma factor (sigma-70 family)
MPINDPFDILRRGRPAPLPQPPDDSQDDDGSSSDAAPNTFVSAQQVGRQQVMAQQSAVDQQAMSDISSAQQQQAAQDAAAQKAQQAQDKIDAANQAVQDKADADNLKANGAVTQAAVSAGPDGRARVIQQQQTNPDGTPAYQPADLGIKYGPDGSPFNVSRNQWGAQDWSNPYSAANANLKLTKPTEGQPDGGGQIMAKPLGKNAAALPEKDVTDQGVTVGGTMKDAQGNVIKDAQGNPLPDIQVAPNAPINQPQLQPEIDDAEQKLVKAAALQRVKDTVGTDASDAAQTLADATDAHADAIDAAKLANDAKGNPLADGYDPYKAASALQAAQKDAVVKAQAKAAAKQDSDTKTAEYKKALLDPVAYVQSQADAQANGSAPAANPSPADSSQPAPTPNWPSTLPSEWQGMTGAQLGQVNPPPGQQQAWAQAMELKVEQEARAQSGQPNPPAAPGAPAAAAAQPSPNPPATGSAPDNSNAPDKVAPGGLTGLITGDAGTAPQPAAPAEKGTWGSWLSNVKTKSVALFGSAIGDIMKGVGGATDLMAAPEKFLDNHVTAPLVQSFMSPANYQKWQDQINAPNPITAAGNQIKANADALASGSAGLQLPSLGPLKGPTLQVDPNRKDLGTNIISGAAGMAPMLAGGEFETPLWMNSGYQNAVDESKKNGDSPLVTQAKGIVGAVTMGGVSKLFSAFGAPASKFFNPVLWGSKEAADGTTTPLLKVLQGGATATTANILTQIAKLAGKGGVEGAGFSVGGQVAAGDNPYAPADASKNTSDDLSSAGSLAALQAVLGTFTHGKTLHQIGKGVDDLVSQTNDARANPPLGQPVQPPLDRATVLAGLIHQNQVTRAQDSFSNLQKQYGTLDSNDSLTPQQKLGQKMTALGAVPMELRPAVVAHLDAAADAQRQTDEAMKAADAEQAKLPPTTPDLGRRSDAYIQANANDIQQAQQTGQPRQRQLIGNETDADILAEAARRQQLATITAQRGQVVAGIASDLKGSLDQTVALTGTPEGRAALLSLNRYNAAQPSSTPKASSTTLQNAMDLAPKPAGDLSLPSVYVEHYLPVSHAIEQLDDPDQKVMATAAIKMTNGRALNSQEQSLMFGDPATNTAPAHDSTTGAPFVTQTNGKPILTDAGLSRLRALVPAATDILPRNEQAQLEAQPPPLPANGKGAKPPGQPAPPPLNNSLGSQLAGMRGSEPDPEFANVNDETLRVQHDNVNGAIARTKERGGNSPARAYLQREKLAAEIARRAAAIAPPSANPMGALAGAREGDEIDYIRPNHEGQPVQTRGEVVRVGPDHYRVVDTHDGVERTVPISRSVSEPNQVTEPQRNGQSNVRPQQTSGRGAEKDSGVRLPGIDPLQITPQHLEAARLLSGIYGKFQATAERLGIDGFSPQSHPEGFIGLAVHPGDLGKIQLDLPRLAQNLAKLRTPAERAARVEEVFDEELRHVALETVAGEDNGVHSTTQADATFSKLWASASKFQKRTVLDLYQKGALAFVDPDRAAKNSKATLENASDANKGREYMRMLSQLQARGRTSEIADLLTPETKSFFTKVVAYLRHVFMRMNDPAAKQLLDQTEHLLRMHPEEGAEDNLDMSPPADQPPANGNGRHPADIAMSNGENLPARYELAELGSLSPSHRNGTPNPDYPHGLNERDYSLPDEKQKNEAMVSNFDPRRVVTDNPDAVNGPPIVDKKGLVLGGNRRTIMLSDPRAYAKYRPYLQANADRFGLNPDDVAKMQQPVLVRRVDTSDDERPELIRRLNEVPTGGIDTANDAVSAGKQITPDLVKSVSDLFQQDPDKTPLQHLSDGDTKAIAQGLLDAGAIRPNDKEKYVGANGNLTPEGARFARSVLLGGVLPDAQLLRDISDSPTETKLLNGLSPLYTMKARGADIAPLREAVALEADRQRLGIKSASEFQAQGNLAGIGQEASTEGKTLQSFLAGIKGNEARRAFTQLQNLVSPLEPGQTGLFGEKNRSSIADVTDAEMNKVLRSSKRITKAADKLRSVVGGGELAEKPVNYPGPLPMPGMPPGELSPEQRAVESKFANWVQADPDRAARAYAALPETEGGRVIDMDEARKLSPDYNASKRSKTLNSVSVQKVVHALAIKKMLGDALASLEPGDTMGLTAGGPGSGKGNIKHVIPGEWTGAKFVYDGVLRNLGDAVFYIDQAKEHGAKTQLWYVHVPVEKAVDLAVGRAEHDGRSLPIKVLATGHFQAQQTAIALLKQYEHDPAVNIKVIDNSGPQARVVDQPLSFLQNERILYRDADEVEQRAQAAFEGHAHRLTDPDAVSIFRSGKTSQAGTVTRTRSGIESGLGQRERSLGSAHDRFPADHDSAGTDRPVAGSEVREPALVPSIDDPRREGARKAYQILTGFKADGKTLSLSQQETLANATRILFGKQENGQAITSLRGQHGTESESDRARQTSEETALGGSPDTATDLIPRGAQVDSGSTEIQPGAREAGTGASRQGALKAYNTLTAWKAEGRKLTTSQEQALENAERVLGQQFLPGTEETRQPVARQPEPSEPINLRSTRTGRVVHQSLFDMGRDVAHGQSLLFGSAVADRPEMERPLARYVAALHQGELNLNKPVDFAQEYETDMGQPAPAPLIARAKELEVQPGEADQAGGRTPAELFHHHLDVADRIAASFDNIPGFQPDDVRQVARVALQKAAQNFNPDQGVPFRGYAPRVVRNALRDAYRFQARRAVEQPTLDRPVDAGKSDLTGKDLVPAKEPTASEAAARNDAHAQLRTYINQAEMVESSRRALHGLLDGKSQVEMAEELGVSPQRVSAMVGIGLENLRKFLAEKGINRGDLLGASGVHLIPDFSNTGEFQETKDNFDVEQPESWPIDGKEATTLKAQLGDPDDNEQVQALNEIINKLGEDEWPKAVRDKAEQVRDALVAHLGANNERIAKEGPAWQKVLDDPAREIAHNFQAEDTDTWPPKSEAAWNDLDLNDPKTWPAGLEAAAEKAGMVHHDDPEAPEIDQDYAQQWMADHVARPEWLQSVDKLPDGAQILDDRAQSDRDAEIHAEAERRTAPLPVGMELRRTAGERDAVSRELTQKHGIDRGYLTAYGKTDGPWHARDYGDRDTTRSVQMNDEDSARARSAEADYQRAREAAVQTEAAHQANVAQEMANKPLRDYRRPLDAQEGEPDQGSVFGGSVMDAPTDTNRLPRDGFSIENYREPDPAHEKHLLDELPSAERARAQIGKKFFGIPVKAAIDKIPLDSDIQKGAELLHNVKDQALKFLAPQVRTEQAGQAGDLYSHRAAEYRLMRTQAIEAVKAARTIIDRKGKNALDYTLSIARAIESGTPHPDPEAREIVKLFTAINDRFRDMVRSLPGTHFRNYIVDYFPHMFAQGDQAKASKFYDRKLQGSTAFVKHRSIPTIQEAVDAGLHLKSDNAADLFLLKWDEMLRYKMGQDYLADMKENNLAQQFDSDAAAPMGWSQIDSRIGKSTVSVPAHRDTPGAYEVKNNQPPLPGMVTEKKFMVDKASHYYAPDSVAQVLSNHLAPGLSDYAWYKGSMVLANTLNQANLGFSAFHLGFVTCDSMISKQADAMESLIKDRDPAAAAKKMLQAYTPGVAPILNYLAGDKLMKAALAPGTEKNSELNAMIDAVVKGGGDVKRGEIYSSGWIQAMKQQWHKGTALGYAQAGIRSPFALIEAAAHPILGHIVPRVKLGVFMDMARRELRRLGPDASHQETLKALQGAWASVDNRLGEFAYDNLHVHEGAKHVAFLAIRSVGWDLGTARELGLGSLDGVKAAGKLISGAGSAEDFSHRLAYTISLPMMLGAYGALATYLATGKGPQDLRDYFFPPTGEIDPFGHKMRYAPPTYGKDVAGLFHQPIQTAINKLNPIWSNFFNIIQNRDFWGNEVYSPDDPWYQKGASMMRYEVGAFEPFAVSGYLQNRKMGVGVAKSIAPFFGLTPAASWIDKTPAEARASEIENRLNAGESHSSADEANYQVKSTLREQLARAGDDPKARKAALQAITAAILAKTIQPSDAEKIALGAKLSPLERMVKGIGMEYETPTKYDPGTGYKMLLSIYNKASPDEARMIYRYLGPIYGRAKARGADVGPLPPPPPVPSPKPAEPALKS